MRISDGSSDVCSSDLLADKHGTSAEDAAQVWAEQTWRLDLDVLDLVAEVREQVPVALLSNASSALVADLELSGITDAFDAIVGSAEIGVAKPAPAAFRAAAAAIGLPTERCAFVDDNAENIEGAKSVGMPALQFTGVDELRRFLSDLHIVRRRARSDPGPPSRCPPPRPPPVASPRGPGRRP